MAQTFFLSDTHFGHRNILCYEQRPFPDIEAMDAALIANWRRVVGRDDQVFLLGDFSFYNKERTMAITRELTGNKVLVMGNHDTHSPQWYLDCGFALASPYPLVYEGFWLLSHEPLYLNRNMPYANLFGHVHQNPIYQDVSGQSFCVCAERLGYTPISFEQIKRRMGLTEGREGT